MQTKLKIVIADDERPARLFLRAILNGFEDAEIVGEAETGLEAVEMIENLRPDLALLDLQMPEATGIEAVKLLRKDRMPLVAFVTAYDEFAVQAFELNAVDYLLKPIERARLREALNRAHERLERHDFRERETVQVRAAIATFEQNTSQPPLERIPLRRRDEIVLLPVEEIVSIVADGELLHITSFDDERFTINFRLKEIEARLDASRFVRLSRGSLVNLKMIAKVNPLPGGTYLVTLKNGAQISVSRLQSRIFRSQFLKM